MSNVTNKLSSINSVEDYVVRQKIFYSTFPSPHLWMMPSPRSCATTTITSSFGKRNVLTVSIHVVDCYTKSSVPMEINWIRYRLLTNAQQQYRGVNSYVSSLAALTISSALAKKRGPSKHHIMWMGLTFSANRKTPMSSCNRGYAYGPQDSTIVSRAQSARLPRQQHFQSLFSVPLPLWRQKLCWILGLRRALLTSCLHIHTTFQATK